LPAPADGTVVQEYGYTHHGNSSHKIIFTMKKIIIAFLLFSAATYIAEAQLPSITTGTLLKLQKGNESWLGTVGDVASFINAGNGTVTSVQVSGGSTGLSFSGGPITTSGTISMAGTLAGGFGGTGQSSYTIGDLLYASSTSALTKLAAVGTGNTLISGGVGAAPSWGKVGLTTHVSGTLPIANGGTNLTALGGNGTLLGSNGTAALYFSPTITSNAANIDFSVSGSNLNLNIPNADASNRGTVSTVSQTLAGPKTFSNIGTFSSGLATSASASNLAFKTTGLTALSWNAYSANQTLDQFNSFVEIGQLTAAITITLPACNALYNGAEYTVHKTGTDTFGVTIDPNAAETFTDSASTKTIYSQGNQATCTCKWNGTTGTWYYSSN